MSQSAVIDTTATIAPDPQPSQALAVRQQQSQEVGLFGTTEPVAVVQRATAVAVALKDVIQRQGLISKISGKEYPRCEAWTLLGTMLGVFPVTVWTKEVEGGWEARVEARTKDGSIIGAAEAECLRSEKNWSNRDDFALRSMAQTRATAKCLRMPLGFVMTLAGYEATPAEEMVADHPSGAAKTYPKRQQAAPAKKQPPSGPPPQQQTATAKAPIYPTPETRNRLIEVLNKSELHKAAVEYFRKLGYLLPTEMLEHLPLQNVPVTSRQMWELNKALKAFGNGDPAMPAFPPNALKPEPPPAKKEAPKKEAAPPAKQEQKPIEVPRDKNPDPNSPDAPWRSFPIPFGNHVGEQLAKVDKKVLFGFWANWRPQETWIDSQNVTRQTKPEKLARERIFRQMLDEAGKHYGFTNPDAEPGDELEAPDGIADHEGGAGEPQDGPPEEDDDIAF